MKEIIIGATRKQQAPVHAHAPRSSGKLNEHSVQRGGPQPGKTRPRANAKTSTWTKGVRQAKPSAVRSPSAEAARAEGGLVSAVKILGPRAVKAYNEAIEAHTAAVELSDQMPAGSDDAAMHLDEMRDAIKVLDTKIDALKGISGNAQVAGLCNTLASTSSQMKAEVAIRDELSLTVATDSVLSQHALFQCKGWWAKGAERVLDQEIAKLQRAGKGEQAEVLQRARADVTAHLARLETEGSDQRLSKKELNQQLGSPGGLMLMLPGGKASFHKREAGAADRILAGVNYQEDGAGCDIPNWDSEISEQSLLTKVVELAFAEAGVEGGDILDRITHQRRLALNEQPWGSIKATIPVKHEGRDATLTSEMVPQSKLGHTFDDLNGGGCNCHMAQNYDHCPNVWLTRATKNGKKLFEAVRHGVMSAYDIVPRKLLKKSDAELGKMVKDLLLPDVDHVTAKKMVPDIVSQVRTSKKFAKEIAGRMRAAAAERRALDVVKTALVSDPDKLQRAIDGQIVELPLSSISLLTPSKAVKDNAETRMMTDQIGALKSLSDKPEVKIQVMDEQGVAHTVTVRVKARAFNFGVNIFALDFGPAKGSGSAAANLINGWHHAAPYNDAAMKDLLGTKADRKAGIGGDVAAWLRITQASEETKSHVETLARQIAEIYDSGSYRSAGHEPYKLVKRLAMLSYLMGETTCFNCKSGKDRTGMMDSEMKWFASEIATTGRIPEPDQRRPPEEQQSFFGVMMKGGNSYVQNKNTGAPGSKLDMPLLGEQFGEGNFPDSKGISKAVGS